MSILTQAEEIINGQRAQDYGDALENHQRIASLWNAYLQKPTVDHNDVAVMMILLKIARFMENGYHQDTVVDIAGYAGVLEKMQLPKEERYPSRSWDKLADVPADVHAVLSAGNALWRNDRDHTPGEWLWSQLDGYALDYTKISTGPFTEVTEGTE
ncbi:hypothetical protein SEA_CHANGELING_56 [Mycobacterium phage Changeling]|nr:hypothetical protein SEA_CHANGELING_56 [Mycobacterium phage Changeling]